MQRVKHADRRKETRMRLELGEAVEAAGAAHLSRDEIMTALARHIGTSDRIVPMTEVGLLKSHDHDSDERRAS